MDGCAVDAVVDIALFDKVVGEREVVARDLAERSGTEADHGVAKKLSIFFHMEAFN